jgi:23S rRNA pseudouridine2605 synthase
MVEAVGHRVVELERVAFGPLGLRGLEPGKSRRLTRAEVERLRRLSEPAAERGGRARAARPKPSAPKAAADRNAKPRAPKPPGRSAKPAAKARARRPPHR